MEQLIITPAEAAELGRTSLTEISKALNSGELPAYRQGRNWKIPVRLFTEYIEQKAIEETEKRRMNNEEVQNQII